MASAFDTNGATIPTSGIGLSGGLNLQTGLNKIGGFLGGIGNAFNNLQNSNKASLTQPVNPALPNGGQGITKPLIPSKTVPQLHQDNVDAAQGVAKATGAALKSGQDSAQQLSGGQMRNADGSISSGASSSNSGASSTSTTPIATGFINGQESTSQLAADATNARTPQQIASDTGQTVNTQNGTNVPVNVPTTVGGIAGAEANFSNPALNSAAQNVQNLENNQSQSIQNLANQPMTAGDFQGQSGTINTVYQNQISNALQKEQVAQKAGDQQLTGLNQAGSQVAPIQVSPGTSVVNPTNMQEGFSGLGGLTGLAVANQNIKQYQGFSDQATALSNTLDTLKTSGASTVQQLRSSGINLTNSPAANKIAMNYWKNSNPQAYSTYVDGINNITNQASNMIASQTGQTPSSVTDAINSLDIQYLSPDQLQGFLQNIDTYGQIKLNGFQESAKQALAGNSGASPTPDTGTPATSNTTLNPGSNVSPAVAGAGAASDTVTGLIGDLFNGITGKATNAGVGAAAAMFGG